MSTSPSATCTTGISRRGFLAGAAGLTLVYAAGNAFAVRGILKESAARSFHPNVWATIETTGRITILGPAAEMGQGSLTALPLIFAEELDADWADIVAVQVSKADQVYGNPIFGRLLYTGGSAAVRGYYVTLRLAGAQARRLLMEAAAAHWGVPVAELATEPSVVVHAPSGRRLSYGEIAGFAELPETLPRITEADLKKPEDFRLIGHSMPRLDVPAKVTGQAQYAMDVRVPGMVYAAVLRAPLEGQRPVRVDDRAARAVPGITDIVAIDEAVAVVGETVEATRDAKAVLEVSWSPAPNAATFDSARDVEDYAAAARDPSRRAVPWQARGDAPAALERAATVIEAEYRCDYVYHAQMEPLNATARVNEAGDAAEIWTGTQSQSLTTLAAAKVLGTTPDKITLHQMLLGGGFGRRAELAPRHLIDALLISRQLRKPVKVIWSREDDVQNGWFRPLVAQVLRAGLDERGRVIAWHHRVAAPSVLAFYNPVRWDMQKGRDVISMLGAEVSNYGIANVLAEHVITERRARLSPWRGVATGYTRFAAESFIDELAHALKMDPVRFRLERLLADAPRARTVLKTVAEMAGWGEPRAEGRALGVAFAGYHTSLAAGIAEISLDEATGRIRLHNFWAVVDPGLAVQPKNVEAQVEGAIVYGLGQAVSERITIENGQVRQSNFHDYRVMRMADVPDIHVRVLSSDHPPSAVGELGVPMTGGAVANALFALTGKRLRHLPLTPARVKATLKA